MELEKWLSFKSSSLVACPSAVFRFCSPLTRTCRFGSARETAVDPRRRAASAAPAAPVPVARKASAAFQHRLRLKIHNRYRDSTHCLLCPKVDLRNSHTQVTTLVLKMSIGSLFVIMSIS